MLSYRKKWIIIPKFLYVDILDLRLEDSSEEEDSSNEVEGEIDEETIIKYYFQRGFSYEEIIHFLVKRHDHEISYSTLLRRLKTYGLKRRDFFNVDNSGEVLEAVRQRITEIIHGPGSCGGYRTVWHTLNMEGLNVPRIIVEDILKEVDPEGCQLRKAHRLKRRTYHCLGPNDTWHIDGYDKLKPFGFPLHGAIDGFSRKILWLEVTRSNNSPDNIATYFLSTVNELKGCSRKLITDLGTENGLAASMQCYFHDDPDAHSYVSSPRNQRIEGWWSFYSRNRSTWWRNFFQDLEFEGVLDSSSELSMECLWYCFAPVIQKDLDIVKEHWNSHRIRKSRHNTVAGRPDSLFYLPEFHGAIGNLLFNVPQSEINYVSQHIIQRGSVNEYQDYFDYARNAMGISLPNYWQEAEKLYRKLLIVAVNGA